MHTLNAILYGNSKGEREGMNFLRKIEGKYVENDYGRIFADTPVIWQTYFSQSWSSNNHFCKLYDFL